MAVFKIVAAGIFCVAGDIRRPIVLKLPSGESVAGFYAARTIQEANESRAIHAFTDLIKQELVDLGFTSVDYCLEIEDCDELDYYPDTPKKGFTFYTEH